MYKKMCPIFVSNFYARNTSDSSMFGSLLTCVFQVWPGSMSFLHLFPSVVNAATSWELLFPWLRFLIATCDPGWLQKKHVRVCEQK